MNSSFKSYQKALKQRKAVPGFEALPKKAQLSSLPPAFESKQADRSQKADKLTQLEARDKALRKQLVDELENEIEKYRYLRQAKREEEEKEAQILTEQQQQQNRPKTVLSSSSRPKRGSAFLGLGRKKATEAQVKRTKPEMVSSKGGG